ncbi:MAG: protein subunit of ribonuclease P [Parcubacteria group bacterium Gr01-1014_30]|nr:MAG: protein subunit of ribonuclease P [Parcubacteria group bacterium Gr01-1014_30]
MAFESLKKKRDFEAVFKKGKAAREGFLFLKVFSNSLARQRFGIIVSQKVSKKAFARNKVRRRIREAIRKRLPMIKPGVDAVVSVLPGGEKKSFAEIDATVAKLFVKAKVTKR